MQQAGSFPPLKDRIFCSSRSSQPVIATDSGGRPSKYKAWNEENLQLAYQSYQRKDFSLRQAAEAYDVPKSTLHDRITGKVPFYKKSGPPRYLTGTEEAELVNFITESAKVGYSRSRKEILALVQAALKLKGREIVLSGGWWESFKGRHPKITLRSAEPLAYARAVASDPVVLDRYYDILERTLSENDLMDKPCQIFNCDETGMPLSPKPPKVVTTKGDKHPYAINAGDKTQITVLMCCSAGGYPIPPYVIFDRKFVKPELAEGEVPGTAYGTSSNGWIDSDLFDLWFRHHFLIYAPPARPLLLLLDGHSSHYQPRFIQKAAEEEIIVFCLPPHTTHRTQPLDNGCFGPLKRAWREECQKYCSDNPGRVVTRLQFSQIFNRAWKRTITMENLISGFRFCGVYPFNRDAQRPKSSLPNFNPLSLAKKTGLKYIPLYSPAKPSLESPSTPKFSVDEVMKYQQRFEEGYDIPNPHYEAWLSMYHPEVLSKYQPRSPSLQFSLSSFFDSPPSSPVGSDVADPEKRMKETHSGREGKVPYIYIT